MNRASCFGAVILLLLAPWSRGGAQNARFSLAEELRIGSADPTQEGVSMVPALAVGADGAIYVVQPLSHSVWVYDATGRRRENVGRRGAGPGEFEWPTDIGWRGDSLWVLDLARVRFTVLDADRRTRVTIPLGPNLYPAGLLSDGSVLAYDRAPDMEIGLGRVRTSSYHRLARDGHDLGTVASFSWAHYGMYIRKPGSELPNTYRPQPFSDTPLFDVSSDGRALVVVERPPANGARGTFVVRKLDAGGRSVWSSRVNYLARPLTDAIVSDSVAARAELVASIPEFGATRATAERWIRELLYRPRNLPPVTALVAGRDGTVWLRREAVQRGRVKWLVLGPHGQQIGTADAPAGLRILEADRRNVWGVVTDGDNVPFVVRYSVRPVR